MQVWLGEDRWLRLLKILGLLYLACGGRALAADFTLTWDPNSEPTVAGYKLYYGTASQSYLTNIDVGNKTSYAVTGLAAGTYYLAVTAYDIRGNESGFSNEVIMATALCSAAISPSSRLFGFPGGAGGVAVTAATGCDWTAVSDASWITVSPGSSSGNGAVDYTVAANTTTSPRTGTLTVAGQTHTVTQAGSTPSGITCSYSLSWMTDDSDFHAFEGATDVTTGPGCQWTASSNAGWISIVSPTQFPVTGNAAVTYSVQENTSSTRTGTLTIAGRTFIVNQTGVTGSTCSYSLSWTTDDSDSQAFEGATDVTTGPDCQWTASSNAGWITIVSPTRFPVTGNATVAYSVQENTSSTRTGTLTIAGQTFLVTQTGVAVGKDAPCSFTVSPTGQSLGAGAAVSNVAVTAPSACSWTAANTSSWVTIASGSSGSGDGTVTYSVTANTSSSSRTDTLTIAGKSFTVRQASPSSDTCTYNISPATQSFPYAGGSGNIFLTAPSGCRWTVTDVPEWIKIISAKDGSGNTTLSYTVEQNRHTRHRKAKVVIAEQLFIVKQAGKNKAIFAQVADGAEWVSSIVLTNPSTTETAAGSVSFHNDGGEPLPVSLNNQPLAETVSFTIQPLGSATFVTGGAGDFVSGSAQVDSDNPVSGVVVYSHPDVGMAGVEASVPGHGFIAPVERSATEISSTGVAIASAGLPVNLILTLRDERGNPVPGGRAAFELPTNGHLARFLEQLFPDADTAEFRGTVTVTAEGGSIIGTVLQLRGKVGLLAALPVTHLQ